MSKYIDVFSAGILVYDVFGKTIDEFPEQGTSKFFDTMEIHPGGCAYNTGIGLSRLGAEVCLGGMVGNDSLGEMLLRCMKEDGVNCDGVVTTQKAATSMSFIMVPTSGNRRIFTSFGANGVYGKSDVDLKLIRQARVFHIGGASMLTQLDGTPMAELLKFAHECRTATSIDPVFRDNTSEILKCCFPYLDYFLPNNDESKIITGYKDPKDQLKYYLSKGIKTVGIKMGADGCLISNGEQLWRVGAYKVPVVDTCGAGDAFVAGFLYGVAKEYDILKCVTYATATASFCIRSIGTTQSIPHIETIDDWIANHKLSIEEVSI